MGETDRELGVKDKVLAEYILDLAKSSRGVNQFHDKLNENGQADELGIDLINSIYALVTRLLPHAFARGKNGKEEPVHDAEERKYISSGMHQDLDKIQEPVATAKADPGNRSASESEEKEEKKEELAKQFPGLAIANKVNKEEIELDLDFDNMFTEE